MSAQTKIEWCDSTFNPWRCAGQDRIRTSAANWRLPVGWNKQQFVQCPNCGWRGDWKLADARSGCCPACNHLPELFIQASRRVFCASLADVFDNEVPTSWRVELFRLIADTPNLDWLLLTKRVGNAEVMIMDTLRSMFNQSNIEPPTWPFQNVWLGATVCNQTEADRDIPKLLAVPAAKRFLSMEPLLGPVELNGHEYTIALGLGEGVDWLTGITMEHSSIFGGSTWPWLYRADFDFPKDAREPRIHWVIVGGESGQNARPMHPDWARSLRDQCQEAGVPFFIKQMGGARERERGIA